MSAQQIEAWVASIGLTYEELLERSLVPDEDFIELFPGIPELYLEPLKGIAMRFDAETEQLTAVFVTLIATVQDEVLYEEDLPAPYSCI